MAQGKASDSVNPDDVDDDVLLNLDVGSSVDGEPDDEEADDALPELDLEAASVSEIMRHYGVDRITAEQVSQTARGDRPGLNSIAVAEE